ncbi:MAG: trypsin-like serine protease [Myxococcota bacterium]
MAPLPIVGGAEAGLCEFPSAVGILEDDETPVMCTGTLVHPNVVTLAAHCINPKRPIVGVAFGEQGQGDVGPARVAPVDFADCVGHPQYFQLGFPDIAVCTLAEPVEDVPIVPILAGCEVDLLEVGTEVTIVGFGSSYGQVIDGEVEAEGVGPKRYTTQTIDDVELDEDEVHMVGPDGSQSACFGDSGGPALIELPDGTWRVFGAASRLYDPGGFPPPEEPGNFCGVGVTYGLLTTQLQWLQDESGYDLTPCHDDDGMYAPSEGCGAFPVSPQVGAGTWDEGCAGGPLGGGEPVCEPAAGGSSTGPDLMGSSGDAPGSSGLSGEDTSASMGTGGSTGDLDPSGGSTRGEPSGTTVTPVPPGEAGSSEDSSSGNAGADGSETGCGCHSDAPGAPWALLLLGPFAIRRRRSQPCG